MKKISWFILVLCGISLYAQQSGGMWIPTELNEAEMKEMGMNISANQIFDADTPSIKDAIAHFGGGCTSEVISPKGLLLTNHHCGFGQIQSHSTIENNYLRDGFWANNYDQELQNPGLTASFIIDIKDVTDSILQGLSNSDTETQRNERIKDNIDIISANHFKESYQEILIKPFYKGNKYYLFVTETYKDVRLVGAPPTSIGKFGSDTDNWMWPRHTGDFSLFRIYADSNNHPAEYHPDNIPYSPKHFLPVNIGGIEEDDFTFVFGFPGRTDEYLPSAALEQLTQSLNPAKIKIRENALQIIDKYMKKDEQIKIQYASKFASIANYWKKWIGESQGLERSGAIDKRKEYEKEFIANITKECKIAPTENCKTYKEIIPSLNALYTQIEPYKFATDYFNEAIYRNSESFRVALILNNLIKKKDEQDFDAYYKRIENYLTQLYKNYNAQVDQEVAIKLWEMYQEDMPSEFIPKDMTLTSQDLSNSIVTTSLKTDIIKTMSNPEEFIASIQQDPLVIKIGEVKEVYESIVKDKKSALQDQIDKKLGTYMQAQLEFVKDKKFFPDANSTLRVTYGKVKGYEPKDAVYYKPISTLKGVIEKHKPGDYEFDAPQKLLDLYKTKDFGNYAQDGEMPVNFLATNHTTGGNSGSPALDADGNLIGLNFDRVWEGTMSDYYFDPEISRNIMVDARYILFIIDKYAGAKRLIEEMTLVNENE